MDKETFCKIDKALFEYKFIATVSDKYENVLNIFKEKVDDIEFGFPIIKKKVDDFIDPLPDSTSIKLEAFKRKKDGMRGGKIMKEYNKWVRVM